MKIDNCWLQQQLHCGTQSAGRARTAVQSNTDHDLTRRLTKQIERGICLIEMSGTNYARKHVFEGKAVQHSIFIIVCLYKVYSLHGLLALPWSFSVYSALPTQSTQSTYFTGTSMKCLNLFSIVYTLYTIYTVHWNFPEVSQCIQNCLHILQILHGLLALPWSVSMHSALSTHST
jgi:hypothetical protein